MTPLSERIKRYAGLLLEKSVLKSVPVSGVKYAVCGYKKTGELPPPQSLKPWDGGFWGGKKDSHARFGADIKIPDGFAENGKTYARLSVRTTKETNRWDVLNPQFIAYIDGVITQGLDINHTHLRLERDCAVLLYAYTADISEKLRLYLDLESADIETEQLYFDISAPLKVLDRLNPESAEYSQILYHLNKAIDTVDFNADFNDYRKSVAAAREYLKTNFYSLKYGGAGTVTMAGHTHIDVAWLWTLAQTREKAQRSFSTVLKLMGEYPEYKFFSSQPALYKMLKEEAPDLYAEVKRRVKEGRWDADGAMWVEADCNLTSGESLIRQILRGKKFFKDEFGIDCKILWLPDVFGYSAALPQILKKCGIDVFVTSKITWNDTNRMPYDLFEWRGTDGSGILAYFLTAQEMKNEPSEKFATYNGVADAAYVAGTWKRFGQKELTDDVLMCYGYGDGGGGPTRGYLENIRRMKDGFPGCPPAKIGTVTEYFERLKENLKGKTLPVWAGELYLEFHRGTYTTLAEVKRNNRKSEVLLRNAETLGVLGGALLNARFDKALFDGSWETLLTNQFHDILPGSSIKEVYLDSAADFKRLQKDISDYSGSIIKKLAENVASDGGILVYNPLSFERSGTVNFGGAEIWADKIPAMGYKVIKYEPPESLVKISGRKISNGFFDVSFDENYNIESIFDKRAGRGVLSGAASVTAYEDYPHAFDAWEISAYYNRKPETLTRVINAETMRGGERAGIRIKRKYRNSEICQTIYLYNRIPRIDFDTEIEWRDEHVLLKAEFPVNINAVKAVYDIQFGAAERTAVNNTPWDTAMFEVCGHKFADYSEYNYGVSLLNDCKYGYGIKDGKMTLTLLRSPTDPNADADKGSHKFTYSLMPHSGDYREAGIIRAAYELNEPMTAVKIKKQAGVLPSEYSLLSVNAKNIIVETVKPAEDGNGVIVRAYEAFNQKTDAELKPGFKFSKAYICDMLENVEKELPVKDGALQAGFKPYEIVTVRIVK